MSDMQRVPEITPSDAAPTEARELFDLTGRVALVTGGPAGSVSRSPAPLPRPARTW